MSSGIVLPSQVELDIRHVDGLEPSEVVGATIIGLGGNRFVLVGGMSKRLAVAASIMGGRDFTNGPVHEGDCLEAADILIAEEKRQRDQAHAG